MKGTVEQLGAVIRNSFGRMSAEEKARVHQEILERMLIARPCSEIVN